MSTRSTFGLSLLTDDAVGLRLKVGQRSEDSVILVQLYLIQLYFRFHLVQNLSLQFSSSFSFVYDNHF